MSLRSLTDKIVSPTQVAEQATRLRESGKRIVTTNGCFDLLHWGHLSYLHQARLKGDVLWVGLNTDRSVRGLKGNGRPIVDEQTRLKQLAALESVDFVSLFDEKTPVEFIRKIRPAIHVKGGDYAGKETPESKAIAEWGGKFETLAFEPGLSTTALIEKLLNVFGNK